MKVASPKKRLLADRALRDAAKDVVVTDVALLQNDVAQNSIGSRLLDASSEKARFAADGAVDIAGNNRGSLTAGAALAITGAVMWFLREPIISAINSALQPDDHNDADEADEEADPQGSGADIPETEFHQQTEPEYDRPD